MAPVLAWLGLAACLAPPAGSDPAAELLSAIGNPELLIATEERLVAELQSSASAETRLLALDLWLRLRPNGTAACRLLEIAGAPPASRPATVLCLQAHRLRRRGDLEPARDLARRASRLEPDDPMTLMMRALEAREDGRFDERPDGAIPLLESLVALQPGCSTSLYLLVDTLRIAGRPQVALAWLERCTGASSAEARVALDDTLWAGGLAADIEAMDLQRPRAARARCRELVRLADGGPAASAARAAVLSEWYSRSADEAAAHFSSRRRLALIASLSTAGWLALLALVVPLVTRRKTDSFGL